MPSAEQQSDAIQISGPVAKVEAARQALLGRVNELEKEREDRVLRSFAVNVSLKKKNYKKQVSYSSSLISCEPQG